MGIFADIFRKLKLPHPVQGKCGGASRDCSEIPDLEFIMLPWNQRAYAKHDKSLAKAKTREERIEADYVLAKELRVGDPRKLRWWAKVYWWGAIKVFKERRKK